MLKVKKSTKIVFISVQKNQLCFVGQTIKISSENGNKFSEIS